jgi:hypothetical protein
VFAGASGVYSQDNSNLFWDDTSNFLGLGTAAPTNYVQLGASSVIGQDVNSLYIGSNFKNNGQRITANYAAQTYWDQTNGAVVFRTAASGAAGSAISFTETMRIHASGGVSIGNTTDPGATNLSVTGSIAFANVANGIGKTGTFTRDSNSATGNVAYTGVGFKPSLIVFYAAIDTVSDFMVGSGTASAGRALYNNFANSLGANSQAVAFYYRRDFGGGNFSIQSATIASMDADGFTLAYTRTQGGSGASNSIVVNYIAYK